MASVGTPASICPKTALHTVPKGCEGDTVFLLVPKMAGFDVQAVECDLGFDGFFIR